MPFTITTEDVTFDEDSFSRPTRVTGTVSLHTVGVKVVPAPLAGDQDGMDRGHVVAESLGGPNTSNNIVPMHPTFHQVGGTWRQLEQRIRAIRSDYKYVSFTVDIVYIDAMDPYVPAGFRVTAKCGDTSADYDVYFNQQKLDNYLIPHEAAMPVQVDVSGHNLVIAIREAEEEIRTSGWTVEDGIETSRTLVAPKTIERPYAVLDYLWVIGHPALMDILGPRYNPGGRKGFTQQQKFVIYLVNRLRNNGWLVSDYTGDVRTALPCDVGGRGAAQVDHVLSDFSGGANLFSNARVCSGRFNNKVRTKTPSEKLTYVL